MQEQGRARRKIWACGNLGRQNAGLRPLTQEYGNPLIVLEFWLVIRLCDGIENLKQRRMDIMALLILGIVIFLGMHLVRVVAPGLRASVIERNGKGAWMGIYTVISLIGLGLIIYGFGEARAVTGMLYNPPVFLKHISLLLMLLAFICLAAGFLPAGRIAVAVKHPQILSIKIWALAHLLANGETSSVLLFGSFLAWAVDPAHLAEAAAAGRRTGASGLPLRVLRLSGGGHRARRLWPVLIWKLHEWLIGVAPIVMG